MTRLMSGIAASLTLLAMTGVMGAGCASTAPAVADQRPLAIIATGPISPAAAVQLGNVTAAAQVTAYVLFVDEKPAHCDGALCLEIVNKHRSPALLTINGQEVMVVGPMGPLLPPGSRGYVRLVNPGNVEIAYNLYDSMRLGDNSIEMPLATVLAQCHVTANVGGARGAGWQKTVHLTSFFCRR